jgi:hypothetical protein
MLLCYEHFDGNLANMHEQSCKGRAHPVRPMPINLGSAKLPQPTATATADPVIANNQMHLTTNLPMPTPRVLDCDYIFQNNNEGNDISMALPPSVSSTSSTTTFSSQAPVAHSLDNVNIKTLVNMFACQSPCHPDVKLIPKQSMVSNKGKRVLSFQASWFAEFPWIHYCSEVQGVLCFHCARAESLKLTNLANKRETAFTVDGFSNWKKGIEKFRDHQKSQSHRFAVQQLVQSTKPVDQQLSSQRLSCQQDSRHCLSMLFTTLKYLARQGLAMRGHSYEDGNYIQLLKLRATDVPVLTQWLERKIDMTSHPIQNEILEMFGQGIVRNICKSVQQAGNFAIIVDGTQDISGIEQMSICIRHVDNDLHAHEDFLGLYEPPDTTGKGIAQCILDVMMRLQLPLSALRGQTYDGASNMSGQYKGCQALILEKQPLALYVHCGAHCTNLVSQSVCEAVVSVRDAMQLLQELGSLFSQSIKCRTSFSKIALSDDAIHNTKKSARSARHAGLFVFPLFKL